ncbi:glycosyltransferase family 2 protein [Olsenella profusa]|uniref:Glycosyltransferase family 2 protein n=1 Tax=Olsenella profusa TaxID=138595 RepID=A0ABS2F3T2_9ACTN|nr:glycosyltransferase family A protein [Olsenella profusa]MBM6775480.1 glycosyltransferase family 2 protein [Olsenella profusa]
MDKVKRLFRSAIHALPGKSLPFRLIEPFLSNCKPEYISDSRNMLEGISPKPHEEDRQPYFRYPVDDATLLSFVVPAYNVEEYIEQCIESLLAQQTEFPFEVIVVNDGSTDLTGDIVSEIASRDKRVHLIEQENRGLSGARNTGIDNSRGRFISFVDSDDAVDSGFIEASMSALLDSESDYVSCGYTDISEDGSKLKSHFSRERMGTVWGRAYSRSVWADIRFPEGYLYEDATLAYLIKSRYRETNVHDASYLYRHRENSISRTAARPKAVDTYWIVEKMLDECRRVDVPLQLVADEVLINACFTVFGRIRQFEPDWLLPLFSSFADLWNGTNEFRAFRPTDPVLASVSDVLRTHNFKHWKLLGIMHMVER